MQDCLHTKSQLRLLEFMHVGFLPGTVCFDQTTTDSNVQELLFKKFF